MTAPTARRLAWGAFFFVVASIGVAMALDLANGTGTAVEDGFFLISTLVFAIVGTFVASRRPENAIGWIFVGVAAGATLIGLSESLLNRLAAGDTSSLPARLDEWMGAWAWVPFTFVPTTFPLLLFPDGHPPSARWRWLVWAAAIGIVAFSFGMGFDPNNYDDGRIPIGIEPPAPLVAVASLAGLLALVAVIGGGAAAVVRFRRAKGDERQQLKWLAYAGLIAAICLVGGFVAGAVLTALGVATSAGNTVADQVLNVVILLGVLGIPVGMGVAIMKYHLYDIDLVIKKTVVFGILVALLTGIGALAALLVGLGVVPSLYDTPPLLLLAGVALGLLAIPLYRVATRIAERVVYGGRATPYEVLSEFSERVGETYSAEDVLPRMAALLGEGTGAEHATVWLRLAAELRPAATWPAGTEAPTSVHADTVEVFHRGESLGALSVRMPASDPMNPSKERLIRDLASQAGLVLRNVRLIEELRASRQRLVAAQDEERRKIERNIHDGAQQQLVALGVQLRLADSLVDRSPEKTHEMLARLQVQTDEALEDLRDLARGIYPPLLADGGLAPALEAQGRKAAVSTTVEAIGVRRYAQEVESAVYFCCLEALNNAAKHAASSLVHIRLVGGERELTFEIVDDGRGFDTTADGLGTGSQGMADRLDAIGGLLELRSAPGSGTRVSGRVPITHREVVG